MRDEFYRGRIQRAVDVPFDNSTNDFVSTNAQAAIEEAMNGFQGLAQAKAIVAGSSIIYVSYDELISQDVKRLKMVTA